MTTRTVLVIDDEKPTLEMFELFLNVYGYDVIMAEDGSEGIRQFTERKPAIVFTDIKMPGMDGIEVLDTIKSLEPSTEVIIMTGHGDMDLAVEALNHEATDFINKPISRSALAAALHRAEERIAAAVIQAAVAECREENGMLVMEILGNVNAGSEDALMAVYKETAGSSDYPGVLFSFRENVSINGAGIAVLIQLLSLCRKRNQKVAISGISENFQEIFRMVGVTRFAGVFSDREEALSFLTEPS